MCIHTPFLNIKIQATELWKKIFFFLWQSLVIFFLFPIQGDRVWQSIVCFFFCVAKHCRFFVFDFLWQSIFYFFFPVEAMTELWQKHYIFFFPPIHAIDCVWQSIIDFFFCGVDFYFILFFQYRRQKCGRAL